jgi:cytochrome c oxidase subunit 2
MYSWGFLYANGKESYDELVVPLGKPVKLNITSLDVVHSLFIPAFRIKVDAVNGMKTYVWFYADRLGEFVIQCAEYCGIGHSEMMAVLRIVPEEEYQQWLLTKSE